MIKVLSRLEERSMSGLDDISSTSRRAQSSTSEESKLNVLLQRRGQARDPSAVPLEGTLQNQLFRHVGLIARSAALSIAQSVSWSERPRILAAGIARV